MACWNSGKHKAPSSSLSHSLKTFSTTRTFSSRVKCLSSSKIRRSTTSRMSSRPEKKKTSLFETAFLKRCFWNVAFEISFLKRHFLNCHFWNCHFWNCHFWNVIFWNIVFETLFLKHLFWKFFFEISFMKRHLWNVDFEMSFLKCCFL